MPRINAELLLDPDAMVSQLLAIVHLVKLVEEQSRGHEGTEDAEHNREPGGDFVLGRQEADAGARGDRQEREELRSKVRDRIVASAHFAVVREELPVSAVMSRLPIRMLSTRD